ncbi:MAG: triose-phosphate isomerase, partial [Candidatus Omnitrophota bacterium]
MRKPIIAGNWKMYKTLEESIELSNDIKRGLYDITNVEIVLCPPFTSLSDTRDVVLDTNILLGGQNMHWENEGAFTGEISAPMLAACGAKYVIIGHSERRAYFGESNETVNRKIKSALKDKLFPILCVGEKLEEREAGKAFDVVTEHVEKGLDGITKEEILNIVIAY